MRERERGERKEVEREVGREPPRISAAPRGAVGSREREREREAERAVWSSWAQGGEAVERRRRVEREEERRREAVRVLGLLDSQPPIRRMVPLRMVGTERERERGREAGELWVSQRLTVRSSEWRERGEREREAEGGRRGAREVAAQTRTRRWEREREREAKRAMAEERVWRRCG